MIKFSQIKGVGVGLTSHISFHPPVVKFDGFMLRFLEWTIGAKSVCGFFPRKSKRTSKMVVKTSIF